MPKKRRLTATVLGALFTAFSAASSAQHVKSLADDYIRTDFTVEKGLPDNVVNSIVQTENGLLWVGTQAGLATFDGRDFHPVQIKIPGAPPQGAIHSLLVASNGDLWMGTDAGVVLLPKKVQDDPDAASPVFFPLGTEKSDEVETVFQTREGMLWVGTAHGLYRLDKNSFVTVLTGPFVSRIGEALNGNLLVVTSQTFFEFDGEKAVDSPDLLSQLHIQPGEIFDVHQDRTGTTWYNTKTGVSRQRGNVFDHLGPYQPSSAQSERTYEDPAGNIWVSNGTGVYKVVGDRLESSGADLSGRCMFVSRDGILWVGTNGNGLLRFRRRVVRMFTKEDGLPREVVMAVLPSHDGRLWVGSNCGLSVFDGYRFKNYTRADGLDNTCVWSLAEDSRDTLWIGTYGGGIFSFRDGSFKQYSIKEGLISRIVFDVEVAHDNSLWIATPDGISHLKNGHFQNYTTAEGLSSNRILSVHEGKDHTIWVESQAGIDRLIGSVFVPFAFAKTANDRLANNFAEDSEGNLYAMNKNIGVSIIEGEHIRTLSADMNLIDMVESADHYLWFTSRHGLFRFARDDFSKPVSSGDEPLDFNSIDRADGLISTQCSGGSPDIAITPDHKLWAATVKGLAMIDLDKWPDPGRVPEVFLQRVTIEGKQMPIGDELVLPAGSHRVEFSLAAVDLASPEKIRLQYRMEGVDVGWNNSDTSRTAVYTNIPSGNHRLHVRATDSNGTWDRIGRTYRINQKPFIYQTRAFQTLCGCMVAVLLSIAYLARVRHLIKHTQTLLEERVLERERIARDLHDTFFQGIQGLLLRFNTATARLPLNEPARQVFVEALEQSDRVMLEGRELVLDLHIDQSAASDLAEAFARVGDEFTSHDKPKFEVIVVGKVRQLHPVCGTELYRLGREAIHNAFRHAKAGAVEVEVVYEKDVLKVLIRDDGQGIEERVLREGRRPGHLGLPGMNERAQRMHAEFKIWSKKGNGTEIEVAVSAAIAYELPKQRVTSSSLFRWIQERIENRGSHG
jgi:signal transduction histidine kinase/ligand-binding sensor domain-containing protein